MLLNGNCFIQAHQDNMKYTIWDAACAVVNKEHNALKMNVAHKLV